MKILTKLLFTVLLGASFAYASPYAIDKSHTHMGFSVKHMMISNVKGEFKSYDTKIDFDAKSKSFNSLEATIDVNSIDTDNKKRDDHLKSEDFFFAKEYPLITFKMKSYKLEGEEGILVGDLTIRGVTKEVELKVEDLATIKDFNGNNRVGFALSGKIDRMEYGLKWNKALEVGGVAVGHEVKIEIEVEAVESN